MIPWRELDLCHYEIGIQMDALALDAAAAFYAGTMLRTTSAPGLYLLPAGMRGAEGRVVLRRYGLGCLDRIDLPGRLVPGTAGLAEHAQVQCDRSEKKDYRNEVFLQSSPILERPESPTTMVLILPSCRQNNMTYVNDLKTISFLLPSYKKRARLQPRPFEQ